MYKWGDKQCCKNYRWVSYINPIAKVFTKVTEKQENAISTVVSEEKARYTKEISYVNIQKYTKSIKNKK